MTAASRPTSEDSSRGRFVAMRTPEVVGIEPYDQSSQEQAQADA